MTVDRKAATDVVFQALDVVNELRAPTSQIPKILDVELFGPDGVLDSLAMTILVLSIEQNIERQFGAQIDLLGNLVAAEGHANFGTPAAIIDIILDRTAS